MLLMEATKGKRERERQFHEAALDAYRRHGFTSYRDAEHKTGVNYSTVYTIVSRGRIPTRGQVIEWAEGLNEDINHWLDLAGHDPIQPDLITGYEQSADVVESVEIALRRTAPDLPKEDFERVMDVVREISQRDKKAEKG